MSEESEEYSFKRLAKKLRDAAKEHPIVSEYRQNNLKGYQEKIKSCFQKKCYIEAFCIADQYVTEILQIFLNFSPKQKEKELIDIAKILKLLQQIYIPAKIFFSEYSRFNKCRDKLVHEITRNKTIKINKNENLEKICLEIIDQANVFFEEIMALRFLPLFPETAKKIQSYYRNEISITLYYAFFITNKPDSKDENEYKNLIMKRVTEIIIKAKKISILQNKK